MKKLFNLRNQLHPMKLALIIILIMSSGIMKAQENNEDKSLSPYFLVQSEDSLTDQMPLKKTDVQVSIAGIIADVKVLQIYKNEGKNTLEATYIFPASTRAAVYSMKMKIGERTIIAKLKEKEAAKQEYEQAKQAGKTASLLEQHRPNVFQMSIANILPGDIIEVEMSYTETISPENQIYEFVFPTVVGPRYGSMAEHSTNTTPKWIANPYLKEGELPTNTFDLQLYLSTGLPVSHIKSTSHETNVQYLRNGGVWITLKNQNEGNKDFVLQYKLSGDKIQDGLLLFEGKEENFFLAMVHPPSQIKTNEIPQREYVFIVDVSGSMNGFPLNTSKELLRNLIGSLRASDKFNVVLFAGTSTVMSENSLPATQENITKAIKVIEQQRGSGGTELMTALKTAMSLKGVEGYSRTFIIATDGYVSVEKQSFEYIRSNLNNANFFSFGIGSSVNRFIIEGIARAGMGESFVVLNAGEAKEKAEKLKTYVEHPALTNIELDFDGLEVYDVEPASIPDVFSQRPVMVFGKWKGEAKGQMTLKGTTGQGVYSKTLNISSSLVDEKNSALSYLWAREKIKQMDDYNSLANTKELKDDIIDLSLKYNILTQYTSFIAVDSEIRNDGGSSVKIKQPLPLPVGVSNYAVGGISSSNLSVMKCMSVSGVTLSEEVVETEIFQIIEVQPMFIGGQLAMEAFIKNNINYPTMARASNIQGTVYISFIVNKDGSLKDIKVERGIGGGCDIEALRVVRMMSKKWKPGMQKGKAVSAKMVIPIKFSLK